MTLTKEVWRKNVSVYIFELSSVEFQKNIWLAKIPEYQSSFSDLINDFDGCGIPDYLDDFVIKDFLNQEQADALRKISALIDKTGEHSSEEEFEKLWNSKLWLEISTLAKKTLQEYFMCDLLDQGSPYVEWVKKWS